MVLLCLLTVIVWDLGIGEVNTMEISDIIVSTHTGEEITYAYYVELCNA